MLLNLILPHTEVTIKALAELIGNSSLYLLGINMGQFSTKGWKL